MRERILKKLTSKNTLLSPDALDYLHDADNPQGLIDNLIETSEELPFPVGRDVLASFVEVEDSEISRNKKDRTDDSSSTPICYDDNINILKDITGNSTCTGEFDEFTSYFNDRFERLKSIISRRREANGIFDIRRVKKRKGKAKIIGIVSQINDTANGNKIFNLEDRSDKIRAFIPGDSDAYDMDLLDDEVILAIGEVGRKSKRFDRTFFIEDILRPGIPKIQRESDNSLDGKIAFMGDVHVGSKSFLKENWKEFISWINSSDSMADQIKYLVIPGDLIDGIGIYPNQEDELDITDVYEQYKELSKMLKEIPEDITILTIPGNHDIVRNPEPQPSLPEKIKSMFPDNVLFYGNPAFLDIKGLKLLLYHGSSINDLSDLLPQVSFESPITAMKEMLIRRHLVPMYGKDTPIAPEEEDLLVIDDIPDIFVTGHVHQTEIKEYNKIILINSSTWQGQTEYQKMRDIQPDPAKLIIVDPNSKKVTIRSFN